jgi:hypothetical protein
MSGAVQAIGMAVIWNDDSMTPERLIKVLEEQRRHWLETATSFERLKTYLSGTFSLQDAEGNARACRVRAEALERTIQQLRAEYRIQPPVPPQDAPLLFIQ